MKNTLTPSKKSRISPAQKYAKFIPSLQADQILDFGLNETELRDAEALAKWLGVKKCYLKIETTHPTKTVKDRVTEVMYSYFKSKGISSYAHCSTGNTGTSLVWGLSQLQAPFTFDIFIPESQLSHHNFDNIPGLRVWLIEGGEYEDAKAYSAWYTKNVLKIPQLADFKSPIRREANKIAYLEAFEQIGDSGVSIDFVAQAISDGTGLIGADMALNDAVQEGWLRTRPAFIAAQPEAANPVVRCFQKGMSVYDASCTLPKLGESKAFAIRRRDAAAHYGAMYDILKNGGHALDANENEIDEARMMLADLEGVVAGSSACTTIAAIKKENERDSIFRDANVLVMLTGKDRDERVTPGIDGRVSKDEWQKVLRA